jgi:hypothetical protein
MIKYFLLFTKQNTWQRNSYHRQEYSLTKRITVITFLFDQKTKQINQRWKKRKEKEKTNLMRERDQKLDRWVLRKNKRMKHTLLTNQYIKFSLRIFAWFEKRGHYILHIKFNLSRFSMI